MAITPGTDFTEFPIPSADLEDNAADVRAALGLSNVNNTSDANKPVSNATQAALDARVPIGGPLLLVGSGQSNIADASISNVEIAHDKVHFWQAGAWKGAGETVLGAPLYHMAALLADRTGKDVYCVVTGAGGTSISAWIGSGTASAQYVALDDAVTAALATDELTDAGKAAADAFVWVHGEQDASAPTYAADVVTLRGQLDGESWYDQRSAPFLLSRVSGFYDTKSSNGYVIFAQQTQLDFIDPWMIVVDTLGALTTTGDYYANVHFSADGLADIGRRLAGAYVSAPNRNARRYVYDPLDFVNSDLAPNTSLRGRKQS
ncbi:MAG: hypothetical protein EOP85_07240 [Verrucomicrobiaceae bacterium]|nr:MAG: hypothetical protein EOP85_07240 [Verrucomicrobiaceae bacterium]